MTEDPKLVQTIQEINNHKTEHIDHEREEQSVLDFYNEHNHFMYMVITKSDNTVNFAVEFPSCYAFGCSYKYRLYDLKQISIRLNCVSNFNQDLSQIDEYINELPEELKVDWKKKYREFKMNDAIESALENFSSDFALPRIVAYAYLSEIVNTRKDKIDTLTYIQKNSKTELNIDIQDSIKTLKKMIKSSDFEKRLKSFIMKNNSFIKLVKNVINKYDYIGGLATNNFSNNNFIFHAMEYPIWLQSHLELFLCLFQI